MHQVSIYIYIYIYVIKNKKTNNVFPLLIYFIRLLTDSSGEFQQNFFELNSVPRVNG